MHSQSCMFYSSLSSYVMCHKAFPKLSTSVPAMTPLKSVLPNILTTGTPIFHFYWGVMGSDEKQVGGWKSNWTGVVMVNHENPCFVFKI